MEKHEYTIWVSYGLTISSDENFDENTEEGFVKIQNLAKEKLSQIGITEIIADAEFGDIMHDIIEENN